jgi:xanthine dehydrogenase small subunit
VARLDITVNGTTLDAGGAPPQTNLLTWLRSRGLTAAKEGCAEGECGACAVLLVRPDAAGSRYEAVNSCLVTIGALHGVEVVTVEGLGTPGALHPAQAVMASGGGSQCGYCTPGFVASLAGEFYRPDRAPGQHGCASGVLLETLAGNLCRCTGYRPIRDAAASLPAPDPGDPLAERVRHPAQLPQPVALDHPAGAIHRPASLAEALRLLADHEDAAPLAGGTDLGVEANLRGRSPRLLIAVDALSDLRVLTVTDDRIEIGAGLSLSAIERGLAGRVPLLDALWPLFASPLIRNAATLGGNLGTASPIGDSAPALLALEASVVLVGQAGKREVPLADYFTGYRTTLRRHDELIAAVRIPRPLAAYTAFHKIAKRRQDDISSVAIAYAVDIDDGLITRVRIGLGGVAATPLRALATENALVGRPWMAETVAAASAILKEEGTPLDDARASAAYRRAMLGQSLHRLFAELHTTEGARA